MSAPEWNIFDRTHRVIREMAGNGVFVASEGELVRSIPPAGVLKWKVVEGAGDKRDETGLRNISLPAITVTSLGAKSTVGAGLNCADDEAVRIVVQILDHTPFQYDGPMRTYMDWTKAIRLKFTAVPNPFQQDANVEVYDPYVVHPLDRLPAEAQSLVRQQDQVAIFSFLVMVRHHR
jgi:hypothetical protein